jgi:hypothetical protein
MTAEFDRNAEISLASFQRAGRSILGLEASAVESESINFKPLFLGLKYIIKILDSDPETLRAAKKCCRSHLPDPHYHFDADPELDPDRNQNDADPRNLPKVLHILDNQNFILLSVSAAPIHVVLPFSSRYLD